MFKKFLARKSKHPLLLRMQFHEVLKKIKMQNKESLYLSDSDIDVDKTLKIHRLLSKNPES